MRLVHTSGVKVGMAAANPTLINLLVKAHRWWSELRLGQITAAELAARAGVVKSYVSRVTRLAFLTPDVVDAIIAGRQLAVIDGRALTAPNAIAAVWAAQRRQLLPASRH